MRVFLWVSQSWLSFSYSKLLILSREVWFKTFFLNANKTKLMIFCKLLHFPPVLTIQSHEIKSVFQNKYLRILLALFQTSHPVAGKKTTVNQVLPFFLCQKETCCCHFYVCTWTSLCYLHAYISAMLTSSGYHLPLSTGCLKVAADHCGNGYCCCCQNGRPAEVFYGLISIKRIPELTVFDPINYSYCLFPMSVLKHLSMLPSSLGLNWKITWILRNWSC